MTFRKALSLFLAAILMMGAISALRSRSRIVLPVFAADGETLSLELSANGETLSPEPSANDETPSPEPSANGETPSPEPSANGETPSPDPSGNGETPSPEPSANGESSSPEPSANGENVDDLDPVLVPSDGDLQLVPAQKPGAAIMRAIGPVVPTHTFVFYVEGAVYETVILKGAETLTQPTDPSRSGKRFTGWYTDDAYTNLFNGFHQTPEMNDTTTNLYAGFEDICTVVYFDQTGRAILSVEVSTGDTHTFDPAYPAFDVGSLTERNAGWLDQNGVRHVRDTITITESLSLTPVLLEGYTVRFDTQGGEAEITQFVPRGETIEKPQDPTRKGYVFSGWFDAAEGGNAIDFDMPPADNITIFAHWTPGETEYCLVYVVQDGLTWNKYTFHSSYLKKGITGQAPTIEQADLDYMEEAFQDGGYKAYFLNGNKTNNLMPDAGLIQANGSTVATVYMDRVWYTLVNPKNGKTTTARWGENINTKLKNLTGFTINTNETYQYHFKYNGKIVLSYKPGYDIVFPTPARLASYNNGVEIPFQAELTFGSRDNFGGVNRYKIYYYYETLDSTPENRLYETETVLRPFKNADAKFSFFSSEKWKLFATENTEVANPPGDSIESRLLGTDSDAQGTFKHASIWYYRQCYDLIMFGLDKVVHEDIMWGTHLSSYNPDTHVIGETLKVEDGVTYYFAGWYTDSACTDAFDFATAEMPTKDLNLYADWKPLTKTVTFDPNGGDFTGDLSSIVRYGAMVAEPEDPILENRAFLGWTYNGKIWNFGSPVTDDITLVARYFTVPGYRVIYNPGEGTGDVVDEKYYAPDFGAIALSGEKLIPPPGMRFAYWIDDSGKTYTTGSIVLLADDDIILTAVYAPPADKVSLIYDLNYSNFGLTSPVGYDIDASTVDKINNSTIELRNPTADEVPQGYSFAGWYLTSDCSGESFDTVMIDFAEPQPNTVYAKWVANQDTVYTVEFYYQVNGAYPAQADRTEQRTGVTNSRVSVTDADKTPNDGKRYILDNDAANVFDGTVDGSGNLVLKVYFKQQFTIIFDLNGGKINGSEDKVVETHAYGEVIVIPSGVTRDGYQFLFWKGSEYRPGDTYTVTEDHTFTAQWNPDSTPTPAPSRPAPGDVPSTGDDGHLVLWICLTLACFAGFVALSTRKRSSRR